MKKKIAISICGLLGVIAGYFSAPIAAMWYLQSTQPDLFGASVLFLVESFIACNPHNEPPSERVKELSKDLAILQRWQTQNRGSQMLSQDIGLTYARLSGLELEMGHATEANEDMKHSQEELKGLGWKDVVSVPSIRFSSATRIRVQAARPSGQDHSRCALTSEQWDDDVSETFMGLLKWMRLRKSDTKKDDFDASLPQLLRTVYSDLQLKNFGEARRLLLDALEHRDKIEDPVFVAYILSYLSWTWSSPSEYASAIRFFTDYIARYPNDAPAYHNRASTLWYSGQLEAAMDDYSRALRLSPTDILSLSARGQVLAERGEHERALQDLDSALDYLRQNPYFGFSWAKQVRAYALNGRAAALSGLNRFDDSFKDFDRSIKLCPDNAWVYFNRAGAHELKGDRDGAISDYQLALVKKDPALCPYKKDKADARLRELGAS